MKKMLFEGKNIIIDRYAFSGVAFTGAKKVTILLNYLFVLFSFWSIHFCRRIWNLVGVSNQTRDFQNRIL